MMMMIAALGLLWTSQTVSVYAGDPV